MNTTASPKKLLIMYILDILRRYTDENHRLSQREIADILVSEYGMTADRKAIRRNIIDLIDFGYSINYSEIPRGTVNPATGEREETMILSDFWLERDFTDSELRLLINGLLFSRDLPRAQCEQLVEKLCSLSNNYFRSRVKYISSQGGAGTGGEQLFLTIEVLDEAISAGRQVAFRYCEYRTDKKLYPRTGADGQPREYVINPYQMVAANGRYYLICNNDKYDNVSNYRLDRISEIRLLDTPSKPARLIKGLENGLNVPRHMAEHVYMFSGESVTACFTAGKYILGDVIDWLGAGIDIISENEDSFTARVTMNMEAMVCWALQYARHVRVTSPGSLVERIKRELARSCEKYGMEVTETQDD